MISETPDVESITFLICV